jgi:hypothetical protein
MPGIVRVLAACTMLWTGCAHSQMVVPDPTVPHQVAREVEVVVWCRLPDGKLAQCEVRLLPGWWVAGPPVVEGGDGR